ncbi:MAG: hypothetical protein KGH88_09815 [Thaumarchaeota archaeon]|nr:hypothetical protein [Nitrososphaerota archaeon]
MENRKAYAGKWIAILDKKIIAEGKDLKQVYKEAMKKSKSRTPLFEQISEKYGEETLIL